MRCQTTAPTTRTKWTRNTRPNDLHLRRGGHPPHPRDRPSPIMSRGHLRNQPVLAPETGFRRVEARVPRLNRRCQTTPRPIFKQLQKRVARPAGGRVAPATGSHTFRTQPPKPRPYARNSRLATVPTQPRYSDRLTATGGSLNEARVAISTTSRFMFGCSPANDPRSAPTISGPYAFSDCLTR